MDSADEGWKPNGRPTSTIAINFSLALDNAFSLDPGLMNLSHSVAQKEKNVHNRRSELIDLEARLREAEQRLRASQASYAPTPRPGPAQRTASGQSFSRPRRPVEGAFTKPEPSPTDTEEGTSEEEEDEEGKQGLGSKVTASSLPSPPMSGGKRSNPTSPRGRENLPPPPSLDGEVQTPTSTPTSARPKTSSSAPSKSASSHGHKRGKSINTVASPAHRHRESISDAKTQGRGSVSRGGRT